MAVARCSDIVRFCNPPQFVVLQKEGSTPMKTTITTPSFVLISAVTLMAVAGASPPNPQAGAKDEIERGRYLVEEVAKCPECHTPRNEQGELRTGAWLQGAPIWIRPIKPIPNWAEQVPPLAGLPSLTEEQGERVLEKGTGPQGEVLRPPMHIYHLKHEDAKAIIAYLNSLPRNVH
jgi:mono/diheme cytochrome c family protein